MSVNLTWKLPLVGPNKARIVAAGIQHTNGYLNVIDKVMLPPRDVVHEYMSISNLVS